MCERLALHPVASGRTVRLGQGKEGWERALGFGLRSRSLRGRRAASTPAASGALWWRRTCSHCSLRLPGCSLCVPSTWLNVAKSERYPEEIGGQVFLTVLCS